jgi:hypothetical protein
LNRQKDWRVLLGGSVAALATFLTRHSHRKDAIEKSVAEPLPSNSIFMCYRRADCEEIVDRIYDTLTVGFGEAAIFRDINAIPPGVDFPTFIQDSMRDCSVILVFIGREWASCTDEHGRRRIDDPGDHVRIEVETALALPGARVIPVFVRHAEVPGEDELPESLTPLRRRNGVIVRGAGSDYRNDIGHLSKVLEDAVKRVLAARQATRNERRWEHAEAREQRMNLAPDEIDPPAVAWPTNLGFDGPEQDDMPYGWFNSVGFVSRVSAAYDVKLVARSGGVKGNCLRMQRAGGHSKEFGSLMQRCPAQHFIGKVARIGGEVRTEDLDAWAGLWFRIDGGSSHFFLITCTTAPFVARCPGANSTSKHSCRKAANGLTTASFLFLTEFCGPTTCILQFAIRRKHR